MSRLPRTLEQLAKTQGKPVELTIRGDKVLVDKAIAQKLYDPLLHLVRNAVAHGIEDSDVRQMRGKPAAGQIEIRAYNQGNRTIIEVKDDGQGIDYDRIRKRAIERKLVSASQASKLSVPQLLEFIFQPSFSTTTKVDELSGRGVGLDVVRSQLQTVQGSISISSEWEKGTTFYLQLPLTLSIAKLLVCYAGDRAYAFPSDNVEQIVLLQRSQVKTIGNQRVMQWQQEYKVPLRRLSDLLRFAPGNLPWRRSNGNRNTTI
ncbi:MAG: hypothetical protein HC925_08945 [Coleofasciculaceae cyanobacterium SM2_3_26]|nr:hypothetical protein [Coleofasciculaceae cyanobacterium SM2_3_26]